MLNRDEQKFLGCGLAIAVAFLLASIVGLGCGESKPELIAKKHCLPGYEDMSWYDPSGRKPSDYDAFGCLKKPAPDPCGSVTDADVIQAIEARPNTSSWIIIKQRKEPAK